MPRRGSWGRSSEVSFERGDSFRERGSQEERRRPAGANPCPSSCNARYRRMLELLAAYEAELAAWEAEPVGNPPPEPEIGEVRPWLGDPVLCQRCQSQVRQELAELSDLAAIADAENTGHRHGPDADRVSGSKYAPSPSPVIEDLDELASVLRSWEALVKGDDESSARTGYLMSEISTTVARLASIYFTRLMAHDAAADFAQEIHDWHRRLVAETKAGTGRHHKKVPCPRCERFSLIWEDGARYVGCMSPACGRMLSLDEYAQWEDAYRSSASPDRPGTAA